MNKKILKYLYTINYPVFEKNICLMEMKALFNISPIDKLFFTNTCFNPSDSPFIKSRLDIIYEKNSFSEIISALIKEEFSSSEFKVEYLRLNSENISYDDRLKAVKKIGLNIIGFPNIKKPTITFGVTFYNNIWYFGILKKNSYYWHDHDNKPFSYSNSIPVKTAKAILNIITNGNKSLSIIDPCCGIGTTLIEGLSMGYNIVGSDINESIVDYGKKNLIHYNLEPLIETVDIAKINKNYDASIIDLPYGIFSHITQEKQEEIIKSARKISKKMILLSFEPIENVIQNSGFTIEDYCESEKGTFKRYIYKCY